MSSRASALVLCIAVFAVGVSSAGGQTPPKRYVHTYDVRIVGSATTRLDDALLVEKATLEFEKVRVLFVDYSTRAIVMTVDGRGKPRDARGSMSGDVRYTETGSTPCTLSERLRGAARADVSGQGARSVSVSGEWAGPARTMHLDRKQCPRAAEFFPVGHPWEHARGGILALFDRSGGVFSWLIRARGGQRLPFPLDRLRAGKSFAGAASGTTDDGRYVKQGTIRVTVTARR